MLTMVSRVTYLVCVFAVYLSRNCANADDCVPVEGCTGKPDGDYPMCYPDCLDGYYVACSGGFYNEMPCQEAYYLDGNGNEILARLIFDPEAGACVYESRSCPWF
ncbi:uncharacterized protein LOC131948264 [Physella acuta]|uniref:uncharacterized protein LOC131948264 n=1 Tax=Physella acuta TaxID=109671 RepID=UPI0027DB22B5|nr:uncharacterized protein LOC131948264 [Physella acuta]